jgi:hypothetical protein
LVHSPSKEFGAFGSTGVSCCRPTIVGTGGRPPCSQFEAEATVQPARSNTSSHSTRRTFCRVRRHSHVPGMFTINCLPVAPCIVTREFGFLRTRAHRFVRSLPTASATSLEGRKKTEDLNSQKTYGKSTSPRMEDQARTTHVTLGASGFCCQKPTCFVVRSIDDCSAPHVASCTACIVSGSIEP